MRAHEIRQKYIEFFQSKAHLYLPGAPLIPIDAEGVEDRSTLFTSAGMQQFKPYFTGAATPPSSRVVTVQKCLRTGDIDSVGDFSHCTFFEMLGNFSFGDYFKKEVITWTWEFLAEHLQIDTERLCVTVFEDDDEAFEVWHKIVGLPEDRIHRLGEAKNYWPANAISAGPNGPCGPCSEIFYRIARLEEMCSDKNLSPAERYLIDDDAGRYVEIWNNVFTQFNRSEDEAGNPLLTPLPKKNNDTGAGLDRIAFILQGKDSVFETDLFGPALSHIEELSGKSYKGSMQPTDFAFRVVAEHTRSMIFCIADGILPSNEGRGYVLRYIMRRAVRYGKMALGFDAPFLHEIAPVLIDQMGEFYTELRDRSELILKTIQREEENFRRTLDIGMARLEVLLTSETIQNTKVLPGDEAFVLYDTYGFPLKLTEELAAERGIQLDMEGFEAAMERQRQQSKASSNIAANLFTAGNDVLANLANRLPATEFVGYTATQSDAVLLSIIRSGKEAQTATIGDEVTLILDATPFYAESGGQVGDIGYLYSADGSLEVEVLDTSKQSGLYLHTCKIVKGEANLGMKVIACANSERRLHIMRNHTATHLLHAALREILGGHVHQKGSLVAPDRLRFDFTHTQAMTAEEIRRVEEMVNSEVLKATEVTIYSDMPIAEAKAKGAMALFGEKYGDAVRMVEIGDFSRELCGGIHLKNTAQIGLFKIIAATGVASGVRRVEAVSGRGAYDLVQKQEEMLNLVAGLLKTSPAMVVTATEKVLEQRTELEKQNRQLKMGGNTAQSTELVPKTIQGIPMVIERLDGTEPEALANLADKTAQRLGSAVVLLAAVTEGRVLFAAKVTPDLVEKGVHAGNLVRNVAKMTGGGGGGRPDFAQAGGKNPDLLPQALEAVPNFITNG